NGWHFSPAAETLTKSFDFNDFGDTFDFMSKVASLSDAQDHHPEWTHSHDTLHVTLHTNTVDAVTQEDVYLAQEMDSIYDDHVSR
ncbi:pterin-4-alpha-carbinolamine dehydratase, partial [Chytriomyces sp. MP71]